MPYLSRNPAARILIASAVVSVVVLSGVSVTCLIQASQHGARMEAAISSAQALVNEHEAELRDRLASAIGIESLSTKDAKHEALLASYRPGEEGGRLTFIRLGQRYGKVLGARGAAAGFALNVTPAGVAAVTAATGQYVAKAYSYENELKKAKAAYSVELDSPWRGMWLRLAGYPKISLSLAKAHLPKPSPGHRPVK